MLHCIVLYCILLCFVLLCFVLYCIVLYLVLYCTKRYCTVLYCTVLIVLYCSATQLANPNPNPNPYPRVSSTPAPSKSARSPRVVSSAPPKIIGGGGDRSDNKKTSDPNDDSIGEPANTAELDVNSNNRITEASISQVGCDKVEVINGDCADSINSLTAVQVAEKVVALGAAYKAYRDLIVDNGIDGMFLSSLQRDEIAESVDYLLDY